MAQYSVKNYLTVLKFFAKSQLWFWETRKSDDQQWCAASASCSQTTFRQFPSTLLVLCCQFVPGRFWRLMTKDVSTGCVKVFIDCFQTIFRQHSEDVHMMAAVANFLSLANMVVADFLPLEPTSWSSHGNIWEYLKISTCYAGKRGVLMVIL